MKVGDLVRWKTFGDIGVFITLKEGRWRPYCQVYLLKQAEMYHIHINELEVICGEERQEKEEDKGKKGSVACGV